MAKKKGKDNTQYVRKETFWLGTLLALAVGFFSGVMFAVLKSDSGTAPRMPPGQAPQAQVAAPARPNMIASLEDETARAGCWASRTDVQSGRNKKAATALRMIFLRLDPER